MEFRVGHLAYLTNDMEKTLAFYTEALGFKHIFSIADDEGKPWIEYTMSADGRFVEFFYPSEGKKADLGTSYMHLCLEVDDCAKAVEELRAKGVAIRIECNRGKDGNFQAWIDDPDGRPVEIMQLSPDSDQYKARCGK